MGDSITHAGKYCGYIYAYYITRFPKVKYRVINCGTAGDNSLDVLNRLEYDVLQHNPDIAVIMLGMNDFGYLSYGIDSYSEEMVIQHQKSIETYEENMNDLI